MPAPFISSSMTHAASPQLAAPPGSPRAWAGTETSSSTAPNFAKRFAGSRTRASTSLSELGWPKPSLTTAMRSPPTPLAAGGDAALARVEAVGSGNHFQQQRVVGNGRGHRTAGVDGDLEQPNAGIGNEPESRLQADDAAMAGRDAD